MSASTNPRNLRNLLHAQALPRSPGKRNKKPLQADRIRHSLSSLISQPPLRHESPRLRKELRIIMDVGDTHTDWGSSGDHDISVFRITIGSTSWKPGCDAVVHSQPLVHNCIHVWELFELCPCDWRRCLSEEWSEFSAQPSEFGWIVDEVKEDKGYCRTSSITTRCDDDEAFFRQAFSLFIRCRKIGVDERMEDGFGILCVEVGA